MSSQKTEKMYYQTSTSSYVQVESSRYYWPSKMRGVEDSDDSASKKKIWNSKRKQAEENCCELRQNWNRSRRIIIGREKREPTSIGDETLAATKVSWVSKCLTSKRVESVLQASLLGFSF